MLEYPLISCSSILVSDSFSLYEPLLIVTIISSRWFNWRSEHQYHLRPLVVGRRSFQTASAPQSDEHRLLRLGSVAGWWHDASASFVESQLWSPATWKHALHARLRHDAAPYGLRSARAAAALRSTELASCQWNDPSARSTHDVSASDEPQRRA